MGPDVLVLLFIIIIIVVVIVTIFMQGIYNLCYM